MDGRVRGLAVVAVLGAAAPLLHHEIADALPPGQVAIVPPGHDCADEPAADSSPVQTAITHQSGFTAGASFRGNGVFLRQEQPPANPAPSLWAGVTGNISP
jgi:hypothetical protein